MKRLVTLIFAALFPFAVNAEVPEWYKAGNIRGEGDVMSIDVRQRVVVIDDQQMLIGQRAKVHSLAQEFVSLDKIKDGQYIGYDFKSNEKGKVVITEIWIMDEKIIKELDIMAEANDKRDSSNGDGTLQSSGAKKQNSEKTKGSRPPLRVSQ